MITIIVCSYDGYSDCWDPFFTLLKKYFPESKDFEIILSTTNEKYDFKGLNVKTLAHGDNIAWSERLKLSLAKAKYDIVFPLTEDFFLRSKVNSNLFFNLVDLMNHNSDIDHIRLFYNVKKYNASRSKFYFLERIEPFSKHRFLFLPGLWKKEILKSYLLDFENIYLAEKMGNLRSYIRKDNFFTIRRNIGQVYKTYGSGAIYKGKWNTWVQPHLEKNNIKLDYSIRGRVTVDYERRTRFNTKVNLLKNPYLLLKSFWSVIILLFSSLFVKTNH